MPTGLQLTRNIFSFWVTQGIRLGIGFLFVPYIARTLGGERYGIWVILFQAINYLSLLDLGIQQGLVRFVSLHLSRRDFGRISQLLSTAAVLYGAIGALALSGSYGLSELLPLFMTGIKSSSLQEAQVAAMIIGGFIATRFWFTPFAGSLGGFQRYDIQNALDVAEEIVRTLAMVVILTLGMGIGALACAVFGAGLLRQVVGALLLKRLHPEVKISLKLADHETRKELVGYSRVALGITAGWLLIFNADSLLLGALASPVAAGLYAPGAQVIQYLRQLVNTVAVPLTPVMSHLHGLAESERVRQLYAKGVKCVSFAGAGVTVGVILYAKPFVALWLAPDFAVSAEVMMILASGTIFLLPQVVGYAALFGTGKHVYILWTLVIEVILKFALAIWLVPAYGSVGMAISSAAPQAILYITLFPYLAGRALALPYLGILRSMAYNVVLGGSTALLVGLGTQRIAAASNWLRLGANAGAILVTLGVAGWWLVLAREDRDRVLGFFDQRARSRP